MMELHKQHIKFFSDSTSQT